MYRHIKEYQLKYTDYDVYDNVKLSSLLSILEESSCMSADELGFGYDALTPRNIAFVISNWYIELNRNIKLGEKVIVHTWPLRPKHIIFLRDYEIYAGNEKIGVATARWCMVNLSNFSILPASAFFAPDAFDNYNTERSVEFTSWKIPDAEGGKEVYERKVLYSDYDHYFHVNNTRYADFLMDVFSLKELEGKRITTVQINYIKQCKEGETIKFVRAVSGEHEIVDGLVNGELRVRMRIKFDAA